MGDHNSQQLTAREMVRAHAYPVLAAISSLRLVCIYEQVNLRHASTLVGQDGPGKLIYLKAVQHCEGR
jgi:hypothetical protein